jgi:hypothetical protein
MTEAAQLVALAVSDERMVMAAWDAEGWELQAIDADGHASLLRQEGHPTVSIDLAVLPKEVIAIVGDGTRTRIIALGTSRERSSSNAP